MKAIDSHKIGLIAIAALTLSACENGLTGPNAQDVEGIDAYESIPAPFPAPQPPLLPQPAPPVLIFENGNETLCVPAGRSHQLQWQVFDITGHVNVTLRSREPAATASVFEYTTTRTNFPRSAEGEGNFSPVIGQDENGIIRMDEFREYQYTVTPVYQSLRYPVYSRSGWFRVSYGGSGGALLCY